MGKAKIKSSSVEAAIIIIQIYTHTLTHMHNTLTTSDNESKEMVDSA